MSSERKELDDFDSGRELGRLDIVSAVMSKLEELDGTRKPLEKLRNWLEGEYGPYIMRYGLHEPTEFEERFCKVCTYSYRGIDVDVFDDDCGQQYYFYYNGEGHGCGTYNHDYASCIKYEIDHDLDDIVDFRKRDPRFFGAYCRYADHEHTKVEFSFRGEVIDVYDIDESDPEAVVKIWQDCERRLNEMFEDPAFIESEKERKAAGHLYFNEVMENLKSGD